MRGALVCSCPAYAAGPVGYSPFPLACDRTRPIFYAIDAEGRETSQLALRGPRHTAITTFDRAPDGRLYFGGSFDGPITHTPDAERMSSSMLGVHTVR